MLRPVSARFQTALTFMLNVHRPVSTRDEPGVHHGAGVMRTSTEGSRLGGRNGVLVLA